ncbi:MAG: formate/nitrite transporter family protein, partial [Lactobacillales bacterium]|nr:formate/nitrite transporter family protein [Lactobacillales bacterium]
MNYNTPVQIAAEFTNAGLYRAKSPFVKFALLAILGGAFIALGGLLTVMVAGGMPGVSALNPGLVKFVSGALFPVGLIMVSVAGADLFTSDCAIMVFPCAERKISIAALLKVWVLAYV